MRVMSCLMRIARVQDEETTVMVLAVKFRQRSRPDVSKARACGAQG